MTQGAAGWPYTPLEDSKPYLVIEYLVTYPAERLSLDQLEAKFGIPRKQTYSILGRAVEAGYLARTTDDDDEICYELGNTAPPSGIVPNFHKHPNLKSNGAHPSLKAATPPGLWQAAQTAVAAQAALKRKPAADRSTFDYSTLDLAKLEIRTDVPLPPARSGSRFDWQPLLKRLKVKQSVTLPLKLTATIRVAIKASKKAGQGEFTLRKLNADQLGLWRVK